MSGHSKWHNIRVKKMASDAKRGKVYTRHAKLIQIAAQKGGDSAMNPGLRTAIDNAKADSVPAANIERAIKKGSGELGGEQMEEVMYAAMAPGSVACLIECHTNNRNRTLSNLKSIIGKNGGVFTESSSILWMFLRKGIVRARRGAGGGSIDELELALIDKGAEDFSLSDDLLTVTADVHRWQAIRGYLTQQRWEIDQAGVAYVSTQTVMLDEHQAEKLAHFMEAIEGEEDVSEIFTNAA